MTITTLRPISTSSDTGWSVVPSGTPHGATSDNSDSTYALWSGAGVGLVMATALDSPPAGERRHQVRVRVRGSHGDAWWSVILANGVLVGGSSASFDTIPETVIGSWGFGAPPDAATTMAAYITGQSAGLRAIEVYLDVDSRAAPTFTPQLIDGAGSATTTITDTATPILRATAVDLDDLAPRQYRFWVTRGSSIVWDSGVVPGRPLDLATAPLDNGSYVAHYQIWTTLGANLPYASQEETLAFTVNVGDVPAPENPNVTPLDGTPFYEVSACIGDVADYDGGQGWVEIQRVDCPTGGALFLPGSTGAYASTDNPGADPADLQVTVHAQRDDGWRPSQDEVLAALWNTGSDRRSWRLYLDADGGGDPGLIGRPVLEWSSDGTAGAITEAAATARPQIDPYGRVRLRALLLADVAGDWVVQFATEIEGAWVQVGDLITGAGPADLAAVPAAPYTVGASLTAGLPDDRWSGRIYSVQVQDGSAGTPIIDPDFTGHMAGADSFTDDAGNDWTVHAPAIITSDQRITTVAIQGPLVTDECTSYVDYALPRTGVGITCEHQPEPCCSYYRARTIVRDAGALQISDWSGVFNPGMPEGLIVMWPGAAADIPAGWNRVAELDGRYPKGTIIPGAQPGATGGSAEHTHPMPSHVHSMNHAHEHGAAATGAANGVISSSDGVAGTTAYRANHTHAMPEQTLTAFIDSPAVSPTAVAVPNDPARLEVIWIASDGNPLGAPAGALGITADATLAGWDDYADADERFLKGAAAGADGGATAAGFRDHLHVVAEHTHAGVPHTHSSPSTGNASGTTSLYAGPNAVTWAGSHSHPVNVASASTAPLLADGSGGPSTVTDAGDLPYRNVRVQQNVSGAPDLPVGLICAWRGSLGTIPDSWQLCDGTGGTPDLIARYPRGATTAIGDAGGSISGHSHSGPSHTHPTSGHSHNVTIGATAAGSANVSSTTAVSVARSTHTHATVGTLSSEATPSTVPLGDLQPADSQPLYEEVAFVQLMETPVPPTAPPLFCLTWDDDQHLVRSEGPAGPLWAPVLGRFTWSRSRPFTRDQGVNGSVFVTNAAPGERNLMMTAAVESEADLTALLEVLARPLVLISPSDSEEVWAAPVGGTVRVIKIGRIRQVTAEFIGTGPQPSPQLADVG